MPLPFHTLMIVVYEKYIERQAGIFSAAYIKSIKDRMGHRSGAPYFLYAALCM
jgi:hypothetical protein